MAGMAEHPAWRSAWLLAGLALALSLTACTLLRPQPTPQPAPPPPPVPTPGGVGLAPTLGEVRTPTPLPTLTPTPTVPPAAGLGETFQSRTFKYSVRVPKGWTVAPSETREGNPPDLFRGPTVDGITTRVDLGSSAIPQGVASDHDLLMQQLALLQKRNLEVRIPRSVAVGDGSAALVSYTDQTESGQPFRGYQVSFLAAGSAWMATLACAERGSDAQLADFLAMLQSFAPLGAA